MCSVEETNTKSKKFLAYPNPLFILIFPSPSFKKETLFKTKILAMPLLTLLIEKETEGFFSSCLVFGNTSAHCGGPRCLVNICWCLIKNMKFKLMQQKVAINNLDIVEASVIVTAMHFCAYYSDTISKNWRFSFL